jgi:SAM-dependent methyltransferase
MIVKGIVVRYCRRAMIGVGNRAGGGYCGRNNVQRVKTMVATAIWVPETRIGMWFQTTSLWRNFVVAPAVDALADACASLRERCESPRIFDAGCGGGCAFDLLEKRFQPSSIVAVDIDSRLVDRAREAMRKCRCEVAVSVGDLANLKLADASVDVVFCHQSLHHVSDQASVIREFRRILRPGGVLLVAESCRTFIRSLWVRLFFRHPMEVQRSAHEYIELLRKEGFLVDDRRVLTSSPWWSRRDFGLRERMGWERSCEREPTQVRAVALPDATNSG